ncbi:Cupin domain protein [Roseovarius azorensis]|uniref:Cupin domain protein n=1 Tax=Roseovarius azorensis TaxID=1287727 RepID=A0A1H7UGL3_9RHOB|nr:cupin domain-containing protein [Roseovarius azorensis]SEL95906.1 Cupin domain protein [Roseovarius azorensis]
MEIMKAGTRASRLASTDYFTGRVWQDTVIEAPAPARVRVLRVTFEPGARTAWHTHPFGQTLHVLSGAGLIGRRGAAAQVIRPGDTVWIPPGEEHWHGATPEMMMCHLAVQEAEDGRTADWLEHVSEEEYGAIGG